MVQQDFVAVVVLAEVVVVAVAAVVVVPVMVVAVAAAAAAGAVVVAAAAAEVVAATAVVTDAADVAGVLVEFDVLDERSAIFDEVFVVVEEFGVVDVQDESVEAAFGALVVVHVTVE